MKQFSFRMAVAIGALTALSPVVAAENYIDLKTGEVVSIDKPDDERTLGPKVTVTHTATGTDVEIDVPYAKKGPVNNAFVSGSYIWQVPGHSDETLPTLRSEMWNPPTGTDSVAIELVDAEYRDFPCPIYAGLSPENLELKTHTTYYSGHIPGLDNSAMYAVDVVTDHVNSDVMIRLFSYLARYDATTEVVRAYSHLKYHISYPKRGAEVPSGVVAGTFNIVTGDKTEVDAEIPNRTIVADADGADVEITALSGTISETICPFAGNSYCWRLTGLPSTFESGRPQMPFDYFKLDLPEGCDSVTVEVVEADSRNFHCPQKMSTSDIVSSVSNSTLVAPYEGFWPEQLFGTAMTSENNLPKQLVMSAYMSQYSYETETLKAYSRIKLRINYLKRADQSSIESVEAAEGSNVRYYNLQGVEEKNPVKGRIYIERRGSRSTLRVCR